MGQIIHNSCHPHHHNTTVSNSILPRRRHRTRQNKNVSNRSLSLFSVPWRDTHTYTHSLPPYLGVGGGSATLVCLAQLVLKAPALKRNVRNSVLRWDKRGQDETDEGTRGRMLGHAGTVQCMTDSTITHDVNELSRAKYPHSVAIDVITSLHSFTYTIQTTKEWIHTPVPQYHCILVLSLFLSTVLFLHTAVAALHCITTVLSYLQVSHSHSRQVRISTLGIRMVSNTRLTKIVMCSHINTTGF